VVDELSSLDLDLNFARALTVVVDGPSIAYKVHTKNLLAKNNFYFDFCL